MSTPYQNSASPEDRQATQSEAYEPEVPSGINKRFPWFTPIRAIAAVVVLTLLIAVGILGAKLSKANSELAEYRAKEEAALAAEAQGVVAFETALGACGVDAGQGSIVEISDGGSTLVMPGSGKKSSGLNYSDQECVLEELGAPGSLFAKLGATRALDGTLTASWSNVEASWTYHPDAGLNIIITKN